MLLPNKITIARNREAFVQSKVPVFVQRVSEMRDDLGYDPIAQIQERAQQPSIVRVNLTQVKQFLHLSALEIAWLEAAYVWTQSGIALPDVLISDETMRWQVLGSIIGQRPASGEDNVWKHASVRLRGLGLLAPRRYQSDEVHWLSDDLICYPEIAKIWEVRHSGHAHLIYELVQPRLDEQAHNALVGTGYEVPRSLQFPPVIEDGYERYNSGQALTGTHLSAFLNWWCDWSIDTQDLRWLAGRMQLLELRKAIQSASFKACRDKCQITHLDLLKSIYARAS